MEIGGARPAQQPAFMAGGDSDAKDEGEDAGHFAPFALAMAAVMD